MKRLLANLQFAARNVTRSKLRSFLTLLGILIGIGSVIALQAIGSGAQDMILGELDTLGSDVITVNQMMPNFDALEARRESTDSAFEMDRERPASIAGNSTPPLTLAEYEHLLEQDLEEIAFISPRISIETDVMDQDGSVDRIAFSAIASDFFDVYGLRSSGSDIYELFQSDELQVVIGSEIVKRSFYDKDRSVIRTPDREIPVIGVLDAHEPALFEDDANDRIFLNYEKREELGYRANRVDMIVIKANDREAVPDLAKQISDILAEYRGEAVEELTFSVFTVEQLTKRISMVTNTFTLLLSSIAAISLLVGGIGIGNVMLISVTERIREIGIRKAIGARKSDILLQFLLESVFLSLIGGALGITFGYSLSLLVQRLTDIQPSFSIENILFATIISIIVGIVSGILPAIKASNLNPIDALRYE